jgi:hypothetical protein
LCTGGRHAVLVTHTRGLQLDGGADDLRDEPVGQRPAIGGRIGWHARFETHAVAGCEGIEHKAIIAIKPGLRWARRPAAVSAAGRLWGAQAARAQAGRRRHLADFADAVLSDVREVGGRQEAGHCEAQPGAGVDAAGAVDDRPGEGA